MPTGGCGGTHTVALSRTTDPKPCFKTRCTDSRSCLQAAARCARCVAGLPGRCARSAPGQPSSPQTPPAARTDCELCWMYAACFGMFDCLCTWPAIDSSDTACGTDQKSDVCSVCWGISQPGRPRRACLQQTQMLSVLSSSLQPSTRLARLIVGCSLACRRRARQRSGHCLPSIGQQAVEGLATCALRRDTLR